MNEHVHPVFRDALNGFAALPAQVQAAAKPAPRKPSYQAVLEARVCGIPCKVGVIEFDQVAGSYDADDSDLDYFGYIDCEFDILDRNERPALWLERKMSADDRRAVEDMIARYYE